MFLQNLMADPKQASSRMMTGVNKSLLLLLICTLVSAMGCATSHESIQHRDVPAYATSEAVLPVPEPFLRSALLSGLNTVKERDDPAYKKLGFVTRYDSDNVEWTPALAEEASEPVRGRLFFSDVSHARDIYVHFWGHAIVSSYYHINGKPLSYGVEFAISLKAVDSSSTHVLIRSLNPHVFVGKSLNVHAMGFVPTAVPVAASPLDEYKLLVYVAHLAGIELRPLER